MKPAGQVSAVRSNASQASAVHLSHQQHLQHECFFSPSCAVILDPFFSYTGRFLKARVSGSYRIHALARCELSHVCSNDSSSSSSSYISSISITMNVSIYNQYIVSLPQSSKLLSAIPVSDKSHTRRSVFFCIECNNEKEPLPSFPFSLKFLVRTLLTPLSHL